MHDLLNFAVFVYLWYDNILNLNRKDMPMENL